MVFIRVNNYVSPKSDAGLISYFCWLSWIIAVFYVLKKNDAIFCKEIDRVNVEDALKI